MVAKIATGEIVKDSVQKSRRVRSGHAGAAVRARNLTKEQRFADCKKGSRRAMERS
jgi:hypothetical protein